MKKYPKITPEPKQSIEPQIDFAMMALGNQIDTQIKTMLQEDAVVGRWIRKSYPGHFARFLQRARSEAKLRKRKKVL